jgi:hypothetical protein
VAIELLVVCEWDGPLLKETPFLHPKWEQIEAAIRSLNGHERNDLYLVPQARVRETYLAVGGGEGGFLVTGSDAGEEFPTYVNASLPAEPRKLPTVGGQEGDYPGNWIVSLIEALDAVRGFYNGGGFNACSSWPRT